MRHTGTVRLVSVLLLVVLILPLTSCNRSYDEQEVLENAEALLKKAEILNKVYYGNGIEYTTSGFVDGYYYEANPLHLEKLGFTTVEELKNLTLETFTDGYANQIFQTKLTMIQDESGIQEMTRYYQKYDSVNLLTPVCIMVYSKAKIILKDEISYDYSTLRVSGVKRDTVYVSVDATVVNEEGKTQDVTVKLDLIEESYGWRIDNPCYVNYNDSLGRYEELDK